MYQKSIKEPCRKCNGLVLFEDTFEGTREMRCTQCGYSQIPPRVDPDIEQDDIQPYGQKAKLQQGIYSWNTHLQNNPLQRNES